MRSPRVGSGRISQRCVLRVSTVAKYSSKAFPGTHPWQDFRLMYGKRGLRRKNTPSVATYRRYVSKMSWFWQDSRAVHDSRGPCSEKGPLPGKIFARCILRRRFAGHFGCMARISCQSQLILNTRRFSRPRPLSGCVGRKNCHGLPPGDAPRRNLATARPPRTHRARILPLPVRPRAHQGAILPPSDAGERISRAFCHRRAPGNASRHNLAVAGSPKMHCGNTLPRQPPSRMLLDDILPRRPSTARACCEIAVVPRSRKTPPERSVGQFNTTR